MSSLRHIGIIMDGNRRWAKKQGLSAFLGHKQGVAVLKDLLDSVQRHRIPYLTLFAFSKENWQRDSLEIAYLQTLFTETLVDTLPDLVRRGIRLQVIGELSTFTQALQQAVADAIGATQTHTDCVLTIALGYGGQQDIIQAAKRIAHAYRDNQLDVVDLTPAVFASYLDQEGLVPLDLIIRTSGEQRLSNFLLYQAAYAELVFLDVLWPDFSARDFDFAIDEFFKRERRYGTH